MNYRSGAPGDVAVKQTRADGKGENRERVLRAQGPSAVPWVKKTGRQNHKSTRPKKRRIQRFLTGLENRGTRDQATRKEDKVKKGATKEGTTYSQHHDQKEIITSDRW